MLDGARVLLVEDEVFTALNLATEIEAAGGEVVGPYASVAATLAALDGADVVGAILDATLTDRDVTPVAVLLLERGVAVVLHTALGMPAELARLHPRLRVMRKPVDAALVMAALAEELRRPKRPPRSVVTTRH